MSGPTTTKPTRASRALGGVITGRGLGLFAEVIVVALVVAVCALPVVTALPAFAAGARHLRRHVEGEDDGMRSLLRDLRDAFRGGWLWGIGAGVAATAVVWNATGGYIDGVPGGPAIVTASLVMSAPALLALLRACAAWKPGDQWSALVRAAVTRLLADVPGTLLLALAVALTVLIVWMFAPLAVLAPGLLLLGAVAVESRAR